jgi:hypothetical protein
MQLPLPDLQVKTAPQKHSSLTTLPNSQQGNLLSDFLGAMDGCPISLARRHRQRDWRCWRAGESTEQAADQK